MRFTDLVVLSSILVSSAALAGEGGDPLSVVRHVFDVADTDRSGSLTHAEYEDAGLQRFGVSFTECDANADGETTLAEYIELYERHHPPAGRGEA